jgi:two-component system cell cycle response regulator DivK
VGDASWDQAETPAPGPLVLIVEDNDKNLKLARDLLAHHGFRTLTAGNATDGIALVEAHRPDLVLMDVGLPDMDGVAALKQLRGSPSTSGVPVVAFTAYAMRQDRERLLAAGFDGYLPKPIDIRDFPAQVRLYCDQGRTHREDQS